MFNRARKYFGKNVEFNSVVHALGGIGVGILIASPVAGENPVRWAAVFLILSGLGHWYAMTSK